MPQERTRLAHFIPTAETPPTPQLVVFGSIALNGTAISLPTGWVSARTGVGQYNTTPPAGNWRILIGSWGIQASTVLDAQPNTAIPPAISWVWRLNGVLTDLQTVFVGFDLDTQP